MGSATDPIAVSVYTQTHSPDGTTRNEAFYMTATLNAYTVQLANNIATPVYKQIMSELYSTGALSNPGYADGDTYLGTSSGGPVTLRAKVQVGIAPQATPLRYHLTKQDTLSTPIYSAPNLTVGGQTIYNWIDGILNKLTVQNLYTGAPYTNG